MEGLLGFLVFVGLHVLLLSFYGESLRVVYEKLRNLKKEGFCGDVFDLGYWVGMLYEI